LYPHVLSAAKIGVVTLESNTSDVSVPSKTYNLMSAGNPILAIAKKTSELSKIIDKYKIGNSFTENELEEMCNFILLLKSKKELYQKMHEASLRASKDFSPDNANKMVLE
jgi:glycosyltransferase involved in cell wall biosynthesis